MSLPADNVEVVASYRGGDERKTIAQGRGLAVFSALVLAVGFIAPQFRHSADQDSGEFIIVVLIINAFWWYMARRAVYYLELTRDSLRWRSIGRRGEVPLAELRQVRAGQDLFGRVRIEIAGRRPIRVLVSGGLSDFINNVKRAAPQLEGSVDLSSARRSAYRRDK
jgi:hypothetical protein